MQYEWVALCLRAYKALLEPREAARCNGGTEVGRREKSKCGGDKREEDGRGGKKGRKEN